MVVDERVFHYAKAGNVLDCGLGARHGFQQDIGLSAIAADAVAGEYNIIVTVAGGDGRRLGGTILLNELVGGNIVIFTADMTTTMNRRVVANTAVVGAGGPMTVTLDRPLSVNLALATDHAEIIASRYLDVLGGLGGTDRQMVVGMPPIAATLGQYLWLQTWGPCWITPAVGHFATQESSLAMFRANGSISEFDETDPVAGTQQIAGTVITPGIGGGQGAPFINLMIARKKLLWKEWEI